MMIDRRASLLCRNREAGRRGGVSVIRQRTSLPGSEDLRGAACVADDVGLALLDAQLCIHAVMPPSAPARLSSEEAERLT